MRTDFNPTTFSPFVGDYSASAGYCLLTLQIAIWALRFSVTNKIEQAAMNLVGLPFPSFVLETRGFWTLGLVPLIGFDSDTYAAVAGPLLAAKYPEAVVDIKGLQIQDWWDEAMKEQRYKLDIINNFGTDPKPTDNR